MPTPAQQENAANPQSPPPPGLPSPRGTLAFRTPSPDLLDPADDSLSLTDELLDEPTGPSDDGPRSSTASSAAKPSATSKRVLRDAVRAGVMIAGSLANEFLARDQAAAAVGLYLADEVDAESIGDPLASIANRHGGIGAGAGNPDMADAIGALIGLALYARKQLTRWLAAKEARKILAAGGTWGEPVEDAAGDRAPEGFQAAEEALA